MNPYDLSILPKFQCQNFLITFITIQCDNLTVEEKNMLNSCYHKGHLRSGTFPELLCGYEN
jgi:hypothetical protein